MLLEVGSGYRSQTKAFRKNYAGIGLTYDEALEALDALIPPRPTEGKWEFDTNTCWRVPKQ